jgi:hypothetical protein
MTNKLVAIAMLYAGAASAQQPVAPPMPEPAPAPVVVEAEPVPPAFAIGLKVGVFLPQISTQLTTNVAGGLEASWAFPGLKRRIGLYLEANYTQPTVSRSMVVDPRVPGGVYQGDQTQRELTFGLGLIGRVAPPGSAWNGYLQAGVRAYLLQTITNGSAGGNAFGENQEQSTQVGGFAALGVERRLGPGALLLEVGFGGSSLPHTITGEVSTSAMVVQLGYRLFF